MRKFWGVVWLWILPLMTLLLVQCGSESEPAVVEVRPATLKLVSFRFTGEWEQAERVLIERFRETYPDLQFDRQVYQRFPQYYLEDTPPPDLMATGANYFLESAIRRRQIIDMTDFWVEAGLTTAYHKSLQQLTLRDGKQFYIPVVFNWAGVYYNKALFEQYHLQPPTTWDDFLALCDTLLLEGETPLSISGDSAWNGMLWFDYLNLRMNGPALHQRLIRGEISYQDPRILEVLQMWKYLFDRGYFVENPEQLNELNSLTAVIRGDQGQLTRQRAVMVLADSAAISDLPPPFQEELAYFPFPIYDPSVAVGEVVSTYGYMVPARATYIPEAMVFLKYLSSEEAQTFLVQHESLGGNFAPARADIPRDLLTPAQQQGMALAQEADVLVPPHLVSLPNTMWNALFAGFEQFMRDPADVENLSLRLEEARLEALANGLLPGNTP